VNGYILSITSKLHYFINMHYTDFNVKYQESWHRSDKPLVAQKTWMIQSV